MKRIVSFALAAAALSFSAITMSPTPAHACGGWFQAPCPAPKKTAPPPAQIKSGTTPSLANKTTGPALGNNNGNGIVAQGAGNIVAQGAGNLKGGSNFKPK